MIIYLSGKITGDDNYIEKFAKAEKKLTDLGYTVLNPTWIKAKLSYNQYMRIDLAMLNEADAICMLDGFVESKGAMCELNLAKTLGKSVMYENKL